MNDEDIENELVSDSREFAGGFMALGDPRLASAAMKAVLDYPHPWAEAPRAPEPHRRRA